MKKKKTAILKVIPDEVLINKIYFIRGEKVMLDLDLAELYGVTTRRLKEQVRRNIERFPEDFMFQLTREEYQSLRSQNATLKRGAHSKYLPFVFTEHGVLMLSSVLKSKRAIQVNIQIMRIYAKMREYLSTHKDVLLALQQIDRKLISHDEDIQQIFTYLKELITQPSPKRKRIGFKIKGSEERI